MKKKKNELKKAKVEMQKLPRQKVEKEKEDISNCGSIYTSLLKKVSFEDVRHRDDMVLRILVPIVKGIKKCVETQAYIAPIVLTFKTGCEDNRVGIWQCSSDGEDVSEVFNEMHERVGSIAGSMDHDFDYASMIFMRKIGENVIMHVETIDRFGDMCIALFNVRKEKDKIIVENVNGPLYATSVWENVSSGPDIIKNIWIRSLWRDRIVLEMLNKIMQ